MGRSRAKPAVDVRGRPAEGAAPETRGLGAALLIVGAAGEVRRAEGWEEVMGSPVPESLHGVDGTPAELAEALDGVVAEARRGRCPARRVVRVDLDRKRYYVVAAGPLPGKAPDGGEVSAMVLEITEGFVIGPREGDELRQLAHDLRTPLASMSGAVELLESGRLGQITAEQTRLLGMLQSGMQMMLSLLDDASARARASQATGGAGAATGGARGGDA